MPRIVDVPENRLLRPYERHGKLEVHDGFFARLLGIVGFSLRSIGEILNWTSSFRNLTFIVMKMSF
jgi:hypothetical protein